MIECPNCGKISKEDVRIYDERLRKQKINISPINPVCKLCGSEVCEKVMFYKWKNTF